MLEQQPGPESISVLSMFSYMAVTQDICSGINRKRECRITVNHADRTPIIAVIGVLLLLVGAASAFLGPVEMYCFYLFSEGGRFHYEGFGFGSFMFGNIACQIIGYYLIAILFIPLGYGHVRPRRWARTISLTLFWDWLVVGVPLIIVFLFILFASKDLHPALAVIVIVSLGLSYPIAPLLLIRFYRSQNVRQTFETKDPNSYWIERLPMPILVLGSLCLFYVIVLHIPILFNGLFPFFGVFLSGLQGIVALDVAIYCLVGLIWGIVKQQTWAWWGSLAYFTLLTFSVLFTFSKSSYRDILSSLNLPAMEMEILQRLPFEGFHFAAFVGIPLLMTLGVIVLSKRYFGQEVKAPR